MRLRLAPIAIALILVSGLLLGVSQHGEVATWGLAILLGIGIWLGRQTVYTDNKRKLSWRTRNLAGCLVAGIGIAGVLASFRNYTNYSGIGAWPDDIIWLMWGIGIGGGVTTAAWGGLAHWGRDRWDSETKQMVPSPPPLPVEGWWAPLWRRWVVLIGWLLLVAGLTALLTYLYAREQTLNDGTNSWSSIHPYIPEAGFLACLLWAIVIPLPRRAQSRWIVAVLIAVIVWPLASSVITSSSFDYGQDAAYEQQAAEDRAAAEETQPPDAPLPDPSAAVTFDSLPRTVSMPRGTVFEVTGIPEGFYWFDGVCVLSHGGAVFELMSNCGSGGSGYVDIFPDKSGGSDDGWDAARFGPESRRLTVNSTLG